MTPWFLPLLMFAAMLSALCAARFIRAAVTRPIEEGIKNPFNEIKKLGNKLNEIPKAITKVQKNVEEIPKQVTGVVKQVGKLQSDVTSMATQIPNKILDPIEKEFIKFGKEFEFFRGVWRLVRDIFVSIFSYLECGYTMVKNLPDCWGYYALDLVGKILYIPIAFLVWMGSLGDIETAVWDYIDEADGMVFDTTGYHIIHFSPKITKKCYSCDVKKMPTMRL